MKKYIFLMVVAAILISCTSKPKEEEKIIAEEQETEVVEAIENTGAKDFWENLKAICGKAFEGKLVSAPANDDFADKKLVMHVLSCDDETILIPFNVGDNLSRTWIFSYKNGRIQLKHDHRMQDGKNDAVTMYGGTTTNSGMASMQMFPADQETLEVIPAAFSNAWWVTIDSTAFTYNLQRIGTNRLFTVSFDLTNEVEKPAPSWGWEDFGKE
ncbi:MAG: hypothetical protein COZ75_12340 [Flavobacteriaceae bacterium CG_4_8_14_3_um_filter_34_10]|nr:hypothetical protein [Flavobacteriia bacterium]OIP51355.1 MAG: hypothetical protein AUK33_04680 [Flavobacteriaceae bacterium CG2_30_34_30]PIQ17510.1 MAG: hypothetical protein COW66_11380 [Flavobacteriaceae bacterium CG18_big_fil_WC_8_21_14_2_50_34_36]PIV49653.1 MAG: hypothetical protein COS19_07485 [Flavobacteriaceae bacterium CG02_land_8_20_14_3_00_34_13]PIX08356.1 MAG: hypothetical protein COZ75_12340 [Flavobacteriaceae bacterium CG_4_8_14_3_um_filter_34_10]PIZ08768.1 MAG: hypothetical pr